MDTLSTRWAACFGGPVALHIGINSGPVVAGRIGVGDDAAYAVTGDTVNTAARLLSAAGNGPILVSGAPHPPVAHAFGADSLPALSLKGKAEPVEVWRIRGLLSAIDAGLARGGAGLTTPLIGRSEELGQMLAAFDRALGGRAQVVTLLGDAGTGKS